MAAFSQTAFSIDSFSVDAFDIGEQIDNTKTTRKGIKTIANPKRNRVNTVEARRDRLIT